MALCLEIHFNRFAWQQNEVDLDCCESKEAFNLLPAQSRESTGQDRKVLTWLIGIHMACPHGASCWLPLCEADKRRSGQLSPGAMKDRYGTCAVRVFSSLLNTPLCVWGSMGHDDFPDLIVSYHTSDCHCLET